jgi:alpha-tubulin suppressor-like RCC1 family protein
MNVEDAPDMPGGDPDMSVEPARLELTAPNGTRVPVGASLDLAATVYDANDEPIDVAVTWTSEDEALATVDQNGRVTGAAAGTTTIIAAVDELTDQIDVEILAPVDSVDLMVPQNRIGQGLSQQLVATPLDANGNELEGRDVEWASSDESIIEVDDTGTMIAVGTGTADVSATIEGESASASIEVVANPVAAVSIVVGDPPLMSDAAEVPVCLFDTFEAVVRDGDDNVLDPRGREYSWTVPSGGMSTATLSTLPGGEFNDHRRRVTGVDEGGSVTLTVTVDESVSDDIEISIVEYPVTSVELQAPADAVPVGSTRDITFQIDGNDPPAAQCIEATWSSSDPGVATVTDGTLTALAPGTTDLDLEVNGVAATTAPVDVELLLTQISTGLTHTCGVSPDGVALCWGGNTYGQLGIPAPSIESEPVVVTGDHSFQAVYAANTFTCGLDDNGAAWCWGEAAHTGGGAGGGTPAQVGALELKSLEAKFAHACGVTMNDEIVCWGDGAGGRLGDGDGAYSQTPVMVDMTNISGTPVDLAIGPAHTCVTTTGPDETWCWGVGSAGQLGNDDTPASQTTPVQVATGNVAFQTIAAGRDFTCARTMNDELYCWGANEDGRLGIGDDDGMDYPTPQATGVMLTTLSLGADHACGLDQGGLVRCWGRGSLYRLGTGDEMGQPAPANVDGDLAGDAVAAGNEHSCAIDDQSKPWCWGSNAAGRSGTTSENPVEIPTLAWPAP